MLRLLLFFCLLFISILSSNINQTKLNGVQSKHVYSLLKEQKLAIVFEFRQDVDSEGTLFRMRQGYRILLGLSTERKDSTITFVVQINNELYRTDPIEFDSELHRLGFQLIGGRFQLILDCAKVAEGEYDLKLHESHHKKPFIEIGFGHLANNNFPGLLRELSVDLPTAVDLKCTEIKLSTHARVYRSTMLQAGTNSDANQVVEVIESVENETGETQALTAPPSSVNDLDRRVRFLESQLQTVREFLHSIDSRLKSVELHQRGCILNGKRVLSFGEKHQNVRECAECQCSVSGQLHCGPIGCPHLKCLHPIQASGECCPHCGNQCYYNGVHYEHGVDVWPKQCVRCRCEDGRMECKFHRPEHCPRLTCEQQETPPNQCCPVCTNLDYCSAQANPCHSNALCENGSFGAKCACKQGFFGNGTNCYDIDECLWDDSAREQLGGCQAGTICINMPGSFKCDCLPGFRRLDDKNCLDIIRL